MTIIHDLTSVNSGKTKSNMALFQKYNFYNIFFLIFLQTLYFLRRFDLSQYLHNEMQLVWYWTVNKFNVYFYYIKSWKLINLNKYMLYHFCYIFSIYYISIIKLHVQVSQLQ